MGDTPKATKSRERPSLSLSKRLTKRLSSPQRALTKKDYLNSPSSNLDNKDSTPPHKKPNLDDSYDSPTNHELCDSPTLFLSQTSYPDSPEVGWRWMQDGENQSNKKKTQKHDSGISVEEATLKRSTQPRERAYVNKSQIKKLEKLTQMHKANKYAVLRERMSKLAAQLTTNSKETTPAVTKDSETVDMANFSDFDNIFDDSLTLENFDAKLQTTAKHDLPQPDDDYSNDFDAAKEPTSNELQKIDDFFNDSFASFSTNAKEPQRFDDFFNDSDSDSFLIAASQQIESALPKPTQSTISKTLPAKMPSDTTKTSTAKAKATPKATSTTTTSTNKEKRSSLYMKFFEDDEDDDDLFSALDDDTVLKATQAKIRSPFQRYKSLPAATTTTATTATNSSTISSSGTKIFQPPKNSNFDRATMKRHASSHAISPTTTNLRSRQMHRRD